MTPVHFTSDQSGISLTWVKGTYEIVIKHGRVTHNVRDSELLRMMGLKKQDVLRIAGEMKK